LQVWAYLSVWAIAKRNDIRPAMPEYTLNRLSELFDERHFKIPSLRTIGSRCNLLPWILDENNFGPNFIGTPKDIFQYLQLPAKENISLVKVGVYIVDAFDTVPLWNQLSHDLVIKEELRKEADQKLMDIRQHFLKNSVKKSFK